MGLLSSFEIVCATPELSIAYPGTRRRWKYARCKIAHLAAVAFGSSDGGCARGARNGERGGSGGPGRVCGVGEEPGSE